MSDNEAPKNETNAEVANQVYVRADLVEEVKSSVTKAFGKTPVACDGMLMVSADKYDNIAAALNAICEA